MRSVRFSRRLLIIAGAAPLALAALAAQPAAAPAQLPEASPATPIAVEPVPTRWSTDAARELLETIDASAKEGLTPADYQPDALRRAIAAGQGLELDRAADAAATSLSRDYFLGRVQDHAQFDWHIERSAYDAYALNEGLQQAVARGEIGKWLRSLLPTDGQYVALRRALADTPVTDGAQVALIRANMERWRWLPRDFGGDYLMVNVPTYRLKVMRGGAEEASYDVVVGAPKTPTPQLAVAAERVVVNPWWTLPPSVLAEGGRYSPAKGYVTTRAASGKMMVRQKPGPMNALGRIKIDMPNEHAIYLHDTPAKAAFRRTDRALSHGCIRVAGIDQLAAELGGDGRVEEALDGDGTATIGLAKPMPVYIVYLTAEASGNGKVKPLADIYGRDQRLLAALDGGSASRLGGSMRTAAR